MNVHPVSISSFAGSRAGIETSALAITVALGLWLAPGASELGASTLPPCPVLAKMPVKPVEPAVTRVVQRYYARKHLTPITIVNHRERVLNVREQRVGVHYCANPGGGKSGYVGAVPKNAVAAVMVFVRHKPYPVTNTPASFVTLARVPVTGWKVVSEGTGP